MTKTHFFLFIALSMFLASCTQKNTPKVQEDTSYSGLGHFGHTTTVLKNQSLLVVGGVEKQITRAEMMLFKDGKSTLIGKLQLPRYNHTETLLPDGKILITGGFAKDAGVNALSEIEEINTDTGETKIVGYLNFPRGGHSATLLKDGRILLAGGQTEQPLNTAEIYDPKTKTISQVLTMNNSRSHFESILLSSGQVLLIGGHGSNPKSIEKFNPKTKTFTNAGSMTYPRFIHKAVLLKNDKVLITGGFHNMRTLNEVELYDIKSHKTKMLSPMVMKRDGHSLIKLLNGKIVAFGGADLGVKSDITEIFDPTTKKFTQLNKKLDYPIEGHTAHLQKNNKILIIGGTGDASSFIFDPN